MKCPECGKKSEVIDTRLASYGVRRRHKCKACGHKFTTVEIPISDYRYLADGLKRNKETSEKLKKVYDMLKG